MLSNNPQKAKSWLKTLNVETIAVCDGDKSGRLLTRVTDSATILPEGEDANSVPLNKLKQLLED